jgi:hypothetical protein
VCGGASLARVAYDHGLSPSLVQRWARAERWVDLREQRRRAAARHQRGRRAVDAAVRELQRTGLRRRAAIRVVLAIAAELELARPDDAREVV